MNVFAAAPQPSFAELSRRLELNGLVPSLLPFPYLWELFLHYLVLYEKITNQFLRQTGSQRERVSTSLRGFTLFMVLNSALTSLTN